MDYGPSYRSLRSEFSDVIKNFFDDFFYGRNGSIKNSVTFKIPNKFTYRTKNYFSNPSQSEIYKNTYPKNLGRSNVRKTCIGWKRTRLYGQKLFQVSATVATLGEPTFHTFPYTNLGEPLTIFVPRASWRPEYGNQEALGTQDLKS